LRRCVSRADQGRLILSAATPNRVEVWDSAEPSQCTACLKPFFVKTLELEGERFQLISKRKTKREYSGFQDQELRVCH
jgi:hypothetical protein